MKRISVASALVTSAIALVQLGCGGSASDPKTLDMKDLNSPGIVETVTGDKTLQLRFNTGNFEKEFRGYYIFATTTSLEALKKLVIYPAGVDITKAGIPRCVDNSPFFEAFGLAKATNDCKGTINVGDATTTTTTTSSKLTASNMIDEGSSTGLADSTTTTTTEEKMSNYLECSENVGAAISLPITADANSKYSSKGTVKCTVSKAYDATAKTVGAMANGTSYVVLAMTVATDKYSKVSWSSNIVSDTPAPTAYSGNVTLAASKYRVISLVPASGTATVGTESTCVASDLCSVTGTNSQATDGIYIARDSAGSYPQRILISTPSTASIRLLPRGPQTYDPLDPAVTSARTPADTAITHTSSSSPYGSPGVVYAVYEDRVYDFVMTTVGSTSYRYGKIVVGNISYASASTTAEATLPLTIVMQTLAGTVDYFTAH